MKKYTPFLMIPAVFLLIIIIVIVVKSRSTFEIKQDDNNEYDHVKAETIIVCIKGEVLNPGIYEMEKGSILNDLILIAGGFTDQAGEDINPVFLVEPNTTIYIRPKNQGGGMDISKGSDMVIQKADEKVLINDKVDINIADMETLCLLPGIGEKTANDIIEYRRINGNFETIEHIMKVPGIKSAKFEKIKEYITVQKEENDEKDENMEQEQGFN